MEICGCNGLEMRGIASRCHQHMTGQAARYISEVRCELTTTVVLTNQSPAYQPSLTQTDIDKTLLISIWFFYLLFVPCCRIVCAIDRTLIDKISRVPFLITWLSAGKCEQWMRHHATTN